MVMKRPQCRGDRERHKLRQAVWDATWRVISLSWADCWYDAGGKARKSDPRFGYWGAQLAALKEMELAVARRLTEKGIDLRLVRPIKGTKERPDPAILPWLPVPPRSSPEVQAARWARITEPLGPGREITPEIRAMLHGKPQNEAIDPICVASRTPRNEP